MGSLLDIKAKSKCPVLTEEDPDEISTTRDWVLPTEKPSGTLHTNRSFKILSTNYLRKQVMHELQRDPTNNEFLALDHYLTFTDNTAR
jgi:hypothetical protein